MFDAFIDDPQMTVNKLAKKTARLGRAALSGKSAALFENVRCLCYCGNNDDRLSIKVCFDDPGDVLNRGGILRRGASEFHYNHNVLYCFRVTLLWSLLIVVFPIIV